MKTLTLKNEKEELEITEDGIVKTHCILKELLNVIEAFLSDHGISVTRRVRIEGEPIKGIAKPLLRHQRAEICVADNEVVYIIKPQEPKHGWLEAYKGCYNFVGKYDDE